MHGKYVVREVQLRQGGELRQYFTNVCDPTVLPLSEIARLYARRWDIELAFLTLKRELGLHLIWSSKSAVVLGVHFTVFPMHHSFPAFDITIRSIVVVS